MPEPTSLNVVIPAYNAQAFLERAVNSVFATGYPGVEVSIVEDGSQDDTPVIAEGLAKAHAGRCRVLPHPNRGNHGVSASRNLGIRASASEWVAFLDADDYYLPHRFQCLRRFQAERRCFDAIYESCEIRVGVEGNAPTPRDTHLFGITPRLTGVDLLQELLRGVCWATSAITIRRSLLDRVGLFDPTKRIAEDCDLWFRLAAAGNVVPGDLGTPVSVYWRHAGNTYHYDIEHRVAMVRAMLDAWRWMDRHPVHEGVRGMLPDAVLRYVQQAIAAAKAASRPDVGRRLLALLARYGRLACLSRSALLRQVPGLLLGIGRVSAPARAAVGRH